MSGRLDFISFAGHNQGGRPVIHREFLLDASQQRREDLQQAAKPEVGGEEQEVGVSPRERTAQACAEFARSCCVQISATSSQQAG